MKSVLLSKLITCKLINFYIKFIFFKLTFFLYSTLNYIKNLLAINSFHLRKNASNYLHSIVAVHYCF